jgi:hypothetical protein
LGKLSLEDYWKSEYIKINAISENKNENVEIFSRTQIKLESEF